jgi:Zn-dependent M28 family amino/carboxypeptidase
VDRGSEPAAPPAEPTASTPSPPPVIDAGGVSEHLRALVRAAEDGGTRAAGTPGYAASVAYVAGQLRGAGYEVTVQEFPFQFVDENSTLNQTDPTPVSHREGTDFIRAEFSPQTAATGTVRAVDVALPPTAEPSSSSGCEAADFVGFPAGDIALLQRGSCDFTVKALNAQAAGAVGVILFNEGQPGRTGLLAPIGAAPGLTIPAVFATFEVGSALATGGPRTVGVEVGFVAEERTTSNVLAETRQGDDSNVVMAGAHLDSVAEGPGVNDNGSGTAALLETALQMREVEPDNTVRFAWWAAEEEGLLGSTYYVENITDAQRAEIALYLNFDMIASPNYFRGVYDGTGSLGGTAPRPRGSAAIEELFNGYFGGRGLPYEDTEFSGRSDHQAFIVAGIPAGGLFTGAEGVKTPEQEARYGGVAGEAFDPCYHLPCDSSGPVRDGADAAPHGRLARGNDLRGNLDTDAFDTNADAIAHAVITYAFDTSAVNGVSSPGRSHGSGRIAAFAAHRDGTRDV